MIAIVIMGNDVSLINCLYYMTTLCIILLLTYGVIVKVFLYDAAISNVL